MQLQGEPGGRGKGAIGNPGDPVEPQRSQLLCVAVEHPVEQGRIGNDLAQIHVVAEGGTAGLPERTEQQAADIEEVDHQLPEFGADRFQRLA